MKKLLCSLLVLCGCGIADAVDETGDKLRAAEQRELELKQQIAERHAYFQCWLAQYDSCLADAISNMALCNYEQTRLEMTLCEQIANKECTK